MTTAFDDPELACWEIGDLAAGVECTLAFRARCTTCKSDGAERVTVREAVTDCTEHNRKQRHIIGHKGYAHVEVVHHHKQRVATPAEIDGQYDADKYRYPEFGY